MPPRHLTLDRPMADLVAARDRYVAGEGAPAGVRPVVLASWRRSREHGVDPDRLATQAIDPVRLAAARLRNTPLLEAAEPFVALMHETLAGQPHLIALADDDGLILRMLLGPGLTAGELRRTNLVEGASWHEQAIGCNGVGTALAEEDAVILIGAEHYQAEYIGWTCIGVPIHDAAGRVVGALDLSVPNEHTHAHAWGWTLSVAKGIEASLGRTAAGSRAEAELQVDDLGEPLHSVRGVLDLLASGLDLSPTHTRFLDQARSDLNAVDATGARQREAFLRERELLERLIDSIPVLVAIYDPSIQQVRVNGEIERVLGWTNRDLLDVDIMEVCYPDPAYRNEVRTFMETLEGGWREFEMCARDGSAVHVRWANIRLTDDRRVGIGIDNTERRESLRERDHILAVVSHDLRNPLSTMMMAASLLLEDISEEKKQAQVAILHRCVNQMQRLINDLMDSTRLEGGVLRVLPEPCPVRRLVSSAVETFTPLAEARSVTLQADIRTDATVLADADRVVQVFSNLLSNAVDHTPGGGTITVGAEPGPEGFARFRVSDTGAGIDARDLPKVFERFWQGGGNESGGAGLGLAIARGIVTAHGGEISVESQRGAGTTFHFTLPTVRIEPD